MASTNKITNDFIDEHPHIKNCLRRGLINYSALARYISDELAISNDSSVEAILVAARRKRESLKKSIVHEGNISDILKDAEIEVRNKIAVFIFRKTLSFDTLRKIQEKIWNSSGIFYILEGSDNYTIIIQEKFASMIKKDIGGDLLKSNRNMVMINIKSPKKIETTPGVIAYLTSLFAENGVNVYEFLSCWTDSIFIISSDDLNKALGFLDFQ